jgi:hypothetical protein
LKYFFGRRGHRINIAGAGRSRFFVDGRQDRYVAQELFCDPLEDLRVAAKIDFDHAERLLAQRDPQHDTSQTHQHLGQLLRVDFLIAAKRHDRDTCLDSIQLESVFQVHRQDQLGAGLFRVADRFLNVVAALGRGLDRG